MEINATKRGLEIFDVLGEELRWKNFEGREDKWGNARRNFSIRLPEDVAQQLHEDGWNIQYLDSDKYDPGLKVSLTFNYKALEIFQISGENGKRMRKLDEETVCNLDYAEIDHCDIIINARTSDQYDGISAGLETMWIYLKRNDLKDRYESRYRLVGDGEYELIEDEEEVPFE